MKLIIDIPDHLYNVIKNNECTNKNVLTKAVLNGTPLDDVKAEIEQYSKRWIGLDYYDGIYSAIEVLDNIGKVDMRGEE